MSKRKLVTFIENLRARSDPRVPLRSPPPSYQSQFAELSLIDQFHVEVHEDKVVLGPILAACVTGVYDKLGGWATFDLTHAAMTISRNLYERPHPRAFEAAIRTALDNILAMLKKQVTAGGSHDSRSLAALIGSRVCVSGKLQERGLLKTFWQDQGDYVFAMERPQLLRVSVAEISSGGTKVILV